MEDKKPAWIHPYTDSSQLGVAIQISGSADRSIDLATTCNGTGTAAENVTVTLACGAPIRCLCTGGARRTRRALSLCEHVRRSALVACVYASGRPVCSLQAHVRHVLLR